MDYVTHWIVWLSDLMILIIYEWLAEIDIQCYHGSYSPRTLAASQPATIKTVRKVYMGNNLLRGNYCQPWSALLSGIQPIEACADAGPPSGRNGHIAARLPIQVAPEPYHSGAPWTLASIQEASTNKFHLGLPTPCGLFCTDEGTSLSSLVMINTGKNNFSIVFNWLYYLLNISC